VFFRFGIEIGRCRGIYSRSYEYTVVPSYPNEFGAKIFKITRDEQGNRLTHMKLTGGKLKVRDVLTNGVWKKK